MRTTNITARQARDPKVHLRHVPLSLQSFEEKSPAFYTAEKEEQHASRRKLELLTPEDFHATFKRAKIARHHAMVTFGYYYRSYLAIRSKEAWMIAWHVARGSSYRQSLLLGMKSWRGWQPEDGKTSINFAKGAISLQSVRGKSIAAFQYMLRMLDVHAIGEKPCQLFSATCGQVSLDMPRLEMLNAYLADPTPTVYWKRNIEKAIGKGGPSKKPVGFDVLYFSPPIEWIWEAEADRKGLREVNKRLRESWNVIGPSLQRIHRPKRMR